jgi:NTP pyrophosphatase (non-canonical NTP hydrolase)
VNVILIASTQLNMDFKEAQKIVDDWIQSTDTKYFSELGNLGQLTEEVGEVARVITRTYGQQKYKSSDTPKELSDELADVLFVLICLANQTGIDLTQAFEKNMKKKKNRN